jgi:integrase
MRTDFVENDLMAHILSALTYENRLAIYVSLTTGLRISDVLNLRTNQIKERFTIREMKTGKTRSVRLNPKLLDDLLSIAGKIFVFENRLNVRKHRTRQAVWYDIKRAAKAFRVKRLVVAPHSARKIYAVNMYKRTCSIEKVKELLNHSDEAVTMIYAIADQIAEKKLKKT